MKEYVIYHVFSWGVESTDEFFDELEDAKLYYEDLGELGYGDRRLYKEVYSSIEEFECGMNYEEILIESDELDL